MKSWIHKSSCRDCDCCCCWCCCFVGDVDAVVVDTAATVHNLAYVVDGDDDVAVVVVNFTII